MSEKSEKIVNDGLPGSSNTNQQVLFVPPLNSVPYIGPSSSSTSNEEIPEPAIFLPNSISQEVKNLNAQTKTGLVLTGTADMGLLGPTIGRVDLFESDVSYFFRVSLPGVSVEDNEFRCDIEDNGTVLIKGATTTGEKTVYRYSQIFKMQTQDFCPPGHFTISFKLPGPVNKEEFSGKLEAGIYEGKVKKLCKNSEPEL